MDLSLAQFSKDRGFSDALQQDLERLVLQLIEASLEAGAPRLWVKSDAIETHDESDQATAPTFFDVEVLDDSTGETLLAADLPTLSEEIGPEATSSEAGESLESWASWEQLQQRYENLGLLGQGGMGEVYRVWDRRLKRHVAVKTLREGRELKPRVLRRFLDEARATAQLQHPGIVPVHDLGTFPDGRPYFAMKEIKGRDLKVVLEEVHHAVEDGSWRPSPSGWTFRRLIDVFHRVCEAVGYAHSKGIFHRDIKPSNVMVGDHGEVLVVDWGLVKWAQDAVADPMSETLRVGSQEIEDPTKTQFGALLGTPAYLPPEQAQGNRGKYDARSDVYGLGAMLYTLMAGHSPYVSQGSLFQVLQAVLQGPPPPPGRIAGVSLGLGEGQQPLLDAGAWAPLEQPLDPLKAPPLPEDLVAICAKAMARRPEDRYPDAGALADAMGDWLDGAQKRSMARQVVEAALSHLPKASQLREQAAHQEAQAEALRGSLHNWQPEEQKRPLWQAEDEAQELLLHAAMHELSCEQLLHGALTHAPDLAEAHLALAMQYQKEHKQAEEARDPHAMLRSERKLRTHVAALPPTHPTSHQLQAYLTGEGRLTLRSDPPGAEVTLYRYERQHRRLLAVPQGSLGATPLVEIPLAMGSYLLQLQKEGYHQVSYPVFIERQGHWHGVPPGGHESFPIWLPPLGQLGPLERYVPAGWFWSGGDPNVETSLPKERLWCDGFVLATFPVTNREYIAFLDALVAQGREAEALQYVPYRYMGGDKRAIIYGRNPDGTFVLQPDAEGDLWHPEEPVDMVGWECAVAYAQWMAQRTGLPWRLPAELEWEKAARGTDARYFPWGDFIDPSWCCMRDSHKDGFMPAVVDSYPIDVSPYGVRGLAGNVRDWCADVFDLKGPRRHQGRVVQPSLPLTPSADGQTQRTRRGGAWELVIWGCRAAARERFKEDTRTDGLGFRIARSLAEGTSP